MHAEPKETTMSDAAFERLLAPEEVAERLGLSPVTVGHMLRAGKLPGVKVLRLWRVREAALDDYIRSLEAPTPAQAKTRGAAARSAASKKAATPKTTKAGGKP